MLLLQASDRVGVK